MTSATGRTTPQPGRQPAPPPPRLIVELRNTAELLRAYAGDERRLSAILADLLPIKPHEFRIVSRPSLSFAFRFAGAHLRTPDRARQACIAENLEWLVFSLEFESVDAAARLLALDVSARRYRVGTDVAVGGLDHWCPGESAPPFFATREQALTRINAAALRSPPEPLLGEGVNLVVADEGLSFAQLAPLFPEADLVGGWDTLPPELPLRRAGEAAPGGHGTMVARNALSIAPRARVFDLPIIPPRLTRIDLYLLLINAAYEAVRATIKCFGSAFPGPWVFCNAWGIFDRRLERRLPGSVDYTTDPDHPFTLRTTGLDAEGFDLVFGAGNCGQFCPSERCGPTDRGTGRSIWGVNSSPRVLTVGAVRSDGPWLGYSSQGPGQPNFLKLAPKGATQVEKPDLCLPSQFIDGDDAHAVNVGTSAACGLAAGALAALRSGAPFASVAPEVLRERLRATAARPSGSVWNERTGYGTLDLAAALA